MKKIIAMVICLVMVVALFAGCNMSMGMGSFTFKKVHVDTYHYSGCLTIEKWYDSGSGIEVKTEEVGSIFLSEGTYILLNGDKACPLCEYGKDDTNAD